MTQDFFLGQLRLIAVAVIAYFTGTGKLSSADGTMIGAVGMPVLLLFGPWLWSVYANVNSKLVPKDSVAIQHTDGTKPDFQKGDSINAITKVVGALLFAIIINALVISSSFAVTCLDPLQKLPKGCTPIALPSPRTVVEDILSKPMRQLADFITGGFDDAVELSVAVPNLQDGNGNACWIVMRDYSAVLKAHPVPVTLRIASDLENIRLLNMAANKICQNSACTQVFNELANGIVALSPITIPIPSLSQLCSKVPEIAQVTPAIPATSVIGNPTPLPSPSASPAQ